MSVFDGSRPDPLPTEKHNVALGQVTPVRVLYRPPATLGLGTTDQPDALERSISVATAPDAVTCCPTPKHVVALAHDTAAMVLFEGVACGMDATDHLPPFQLSTVARVAKPAPVNPTARQLAELEQETP